MEHTVLELVPIHHASMAGGGFTLYPTMPTPNPHPNHFHNKDPFPVTVLTQRTRDHCHCFPDKTIQCEERNLLVEPETKFEPSSATFQLCDLGPAIKRPWASVNSVAQCRFYSRLSHRAMFRTKGAYAKCSVNTTDWYVFFYRGFSKGCKLKCLQGNISEWSRLGARLAEKKMP